MTTDLNKINCVSRYGLAFIFFYHGLVPKILWLSPVEHSLVAAHKPSLSVLMISTIGGVLEIILACLIVYFKKSLISIYCAVALLLALLLDVSIVMPELLIQAFNPVSINVAALTLCYLIFLTNEKSSN